MTPGLVTMLRNINPDKQNSRQLASAIPENAEITNYRQSLSDSQQHHQACFASRLTAELATVGVDNRTLEGMYKQASFESGCWRG